MTQTGLQFIPGSNMTSVEKINEESNSDDSQKDSGVSDTSSESSAGLRITEENQRKSKLEMKSSMLAVPNVPSLRNKDLYSKNSTRSIDNSQFEIPFMMKNNQMKMSQKDAEMMKQ